LLFNCLKAVLDTQNCENNSIHFKMVRDWKQKVIDSDDGGGDDDDVDEDGSWT